MNIEPLSIRKFGTIGSTELTASKLSWRAMSHSYNDVMKSLSK